jgi:hypothetical protein
LQVSAGLRKPYPTSNTIRADKADFMRAFATSPVQMRTSAAGWEKANNDSRAVGYQSTTAAPKEHEKC